MRNHIVKLVSAVVLVLPVIGGATTSPGKPGAPVAIEYAFRGEPKAGQPFEVEVKLTPTAAMDSMEIQVGASRDLEVERGAGVRQLAKPVRGAPESFVVRLRPAANGVHELEVRVVTRIDGRSSARGWGIEIPVGANARAKLAREGILAGKGEQAVVVLPAETERRDR
jgi:hypothetical protein